MRLYYLDPAFFDLSCEMCAKYMHTRGEITRRQGLPVLRPKGTVLPCWECPKIPEDAPARRREFAEEMSERNHLAFTHYLECQAVGHFPDDEIVRRNARIIRAVQEAVRNSKLDRIIARLGMIGAISGG